MKTNTHTFQAFKNVFLCTPAQAVASISQKHTRILSFLSFSKMKTRSHGRFFYDIL